MFSLRPRTAEAIFDESVFAHILRVERMRSDRSGKPFVLLLLSLSTPQRGGHPETGFVRNVLDSLQLSIRQTDMTGWYRNPSVIGVILTELTVEDSGMRVVVEKVHKVLATNLPADQVHQVALSVHRYPNHVNRSGPSNGTPVGPTSWPDRELYPDLGPKHPAASFLKRVIDVVGSVGLTMALAPVFLLVAAGIKLTSRGPILFRQRRIGQFGQLFTVLKFRSMHDASDTKLHEEYIEKFIHSNNGSSANGKETPDEEIAPNGLFKMQRDPRITAVGRILRKTSLDELPQLFNVLSGEMSLVGPRPPLSYEVERYDTWHRRRVLEAKPGLTGLWQVYGRSRTTFDEMVRLDLRYVDKWSLWSDIRILLKTPWVVLTCKGAV